MDKYTRFLVLETAKNSILASAMLSVTALLLRGQGVSSDKVHALLKKQIDDKTRDMLGQLKTDLGLEAHVSELGLSDEWLRQQTPGLN